MAMMEPFPPALMISTFPFGISRSQPGESRTRADSNFTALSRTRRIVTSPGREAGGTLQFPASKEKKIKKK